MQIKYEEINKIETKSTCLIFQKKKILNIKASQKRNQNINCLGIFFHSERRTYTKPECGNFGVFFPWALNTYIISGSFSKIIQGALKPCIHFMGSVILKCPGNFIWNAKIAAAHLISPSESDSLLTGHSSTGKQG